MQTMSERGLVQSLRTGRHRALGGCVDGRLGVPKLWSNDKRDENESPDDTTRRLYRNRDHLLDFVRTAAVFLRLPILGWHDGHPIARLRSRRGYSAQYIYVVSRHPMAG